MRHGSPRTPRSRRSRLTRLAVVAVAVIAAAAVVVVALARESSGSGRLATPDASRASATVPAAPAAYLGVYARPAPQSWSGISSFTAATGVRPRLVVYYSAWKEPFRTSFARLAAGHGAVPVVQIDPTGISLAAIARGHYDGYLRSYAAAVRSFGSRVILSFGHEMNGNWYSWGNQHTAAREFVAAWRHIVTVFRASGTRNVTWLWTVNIMVRRLGIPSPAAWWPGAAYVNWVGIDGYYLKPTWRFAPLFGPTIKAIRRLTIDPILISETAVAPTAGQADKIADLFAGVRAYGLLGFIWFDVDKTRDWRLISRPAIAAYRRGAATFGGPA
jgi:mannan endo-1,4-beta-mannosidase